MRVQVLLFASHRELAGKNRIDLDLPAGARAGDVYDRLVADCPALDRLRRYTTFAVNREVVTADAELRAGDEIALLQPVSGGIA
jgi:molybdopterin converting factor small subunit